MGDDGKLTVKCYEGEPGQHQHPSCRHGPTILFLKGDTGYFACAAFRDRRLCNYHLPVDELTATHLMRHYEAPVKKYRALRQELELSNAYCVDCDIPLLEPSTPGHEEHNVKSKLSAEEIQDPTQFLKPLDIDKAQAQYFFDNKALKFFAKCLRTLKISKIVCMGAPRLHAYLRKNCEEIKSYLLDLDHRLYYFLDDSSYAWYNMCNNHFFDEAQAVMFQQFLKTKNNEQLLIFTDPPFGCRTELIANTLHQLVQLYNRVNKQPYRPVPIFWIYPYYSAHYVQSQMPELEMCDYKINYANHASYTDSAFSGARKLGSPVRLFTNVPLELLELPILEEYKYCVPCRRYTALENRHCFKCGDCPSKNGATYNHCKHCGLCVKPYYVHCHNCRRCTQAEGHNCQEYQTKLRCWICLKVGHTEYRCSNLQKPDRTQKLKISEKLGIKCFICSIHGHNEQTCKRRDKYVKETTFLGETDCRFHESDKSLK